MSSGFDVKKLEADLRRKRLDKADTIAQNWTPPVHNLKFVVPTAPEREPFNACPDPTRHTGGKKHPGHDRCIKFLKRNEATARQKVGLPVRTKRMATK